jgi:hypothetical protein
MLYLSPRLRTTPEPLAAGWFSQGEIDATCDEASSLLPV